MKIVGRSSKRAGGALPCGGGGSRIGFQPSVSTANSPAPLLGVLVPRGMREDYRDDGGSHVTSVATYCKFRQFQVNVDEKFLIKK
jgi:hypothetical protein